MGWEEAQRGFGSRFELNTKVPVWRVNGFLFRSNFSYSFSLISKD
jgi:hypothetical protein